MPDGGKDGDRSGKGMPYMDFKGKGMQDPSTMKGMAMDPNMKGSAMKGKGYFGK
jgi:hypothetical protein